MLKRHNFTLLALAAGVILAMPVGCGGDDDPVSPGSGGSSGKGGSGGKAGSGGTSGASTGGTSGKGGTAGASTGGTGGSSGSVGSAGTAGSAGADASPDGTAGSGGTAGASGTDGGAGAPGDAGTCPAAPPNDMAQCGRVGQRCNYTRELCICTATGWDCIRTPLPDSGVTCPAQQPTGTCNLPNRTQCTYGNVTCACIGGNWRCFGGGDAGGACPATEPTAGSACNTTATRCEYGDAGSRICVCAFGQWLCN